MKSVFIIIFFTSISFISNGQSSHDFLIGGGLDIIKTDNYKVFDKAQIGVEAHYFFQRRFALGAGMEIWTRQKNSFMMGVRWYANDNIFLRFRGLIGVNDAVLGAGWSTPLSEKVRLEAMGDFYFNSGQFALRGGIGYVIRR
ncbi:hypothetical protein BH09BAC3_BH09BAC3_17750 [soil metagenome]